MRLCSIASGSSGNCIYAGSDKTHLLIDTGKRGLRKGYMRLESKGKNLEVF